MKNKKKQEAKETTKRSYEFYYNLRIACEKKRKIRKNIYVNEKKRH